MKQFIQQTIAVTEKEIRLQLRWGKDFFLRILISPFFYLIPYFLLYQGIFNLGSGDIGTITPENYIVWLFLGTIFFTFAFNGLSAFESRFLTEKYWMTIQALFLTPINKYALLLGMTIETFLESFITFMIFIILSVIILPAPIINIFGIIFILIIILIASAGLGLLKGGIALINENYRQIISYFVFFILFFSCYSLPISILPNYLQTLVNINPFYHGLLLIRSIWFNTLDITFLNSLIYLIIFTVLSIIIGVWLFNKLIKRFGIHGY